MNDNESANQELEITKAAVAALDAAQKKTLQSGRKVILLRKGQLIQVEPSGVETVLREMPARLSVKTLTKRATQ